MALPRPAYRHLGYALAVALGFFVAQVQRARPAFDRGVVGQGQVHIRALQAFKQLGIVNGNRRLPRQVLEKVQPFCVRVEQGVMENFQHAHDLAFRNERHAIVGHHG